MTQRMLAYFVHADPRVGPAYRAAAGPDVDFVFVPIAGPLSSSYAALAQQLRVGGRILPELRRRWPAPRPRGDYARTLLVTYSAGYKLAEAIYAIPADRDELDGYVAIDSDHAGLDPDGTASDRQLEPFVDLVRLARDSRKLYWLGHSDVRVTGYASTTMVADELVRLGGAPEGLWHVEAYDVRQDAKAEHGAALTEWGPGFVARAIAALEEARGPEVAEAAAAPKTWAEAILQVAAEDLDHGWLDAPGGPNTGDEIVRLFLAPLGLAKGQPYCAAWVTRVLNEAARRLGRQLPIVGSGGAKALKAQLEAAGLFTPVSAPNFWEMVRPGSIPIWDRPPDPDHGHTGITVDRGLEAFFVHEANADRIVQPEAPHRVYALCTTEKKRRDPLLLGVGNLRD